MFVVTVLGPEDYYSLVFEKHEISIGRTPDNDVVLEDDNVSASHGRIVSSDGKFIVVDTNSTNGIYINETKLSAPAMVAGNDDIQIATYILQLSRVRAS